MMSPELIAELAPGTEFQFVAHLPETQLVFPLKNGKWKGGLPSVVPEPGNTVWGAIFSVPDDQLDAIDAAQKKEGRIPATVHAMDRAGKRHEVRTHVHKGNGKASYEPSPEYMAIVVEGGRHWNLPAGWVAGLQEYVEGG